MFKKRTQKGQKRAAVAPPPTDDDDDDDAAPEPIEAVQNSQYWRKRSKGLSAGALATREQSEKEATDAPKEEPAAAPETIEGLMEKKYAGASGAASSRDALHEAALADFIARRTAATAEPPAPAPLSAEDALYVVPKLADAPSITHDAEAAHGIGGGVAFGATGLAEVVGDDDAAEANRRRTARVVADLDRKRAADALAVSSALLPGERERLLPPSAVPAEEDLRGKRGPHLWQRGSQRDERRKALAKSRADRCG